MLFNGAFRRGCHWQDFVAVIYHGCLLDRAMAGYLTALPLLATLVSVWISIPRLKAVFSVYYGIIAFLVALIIVSDTCLYSFWQFKLDATVLNYLDSPKDAFASVSLFYLLTASVVILLLSGFFWYVWKLVTPRFPFPSTHRILTSISLLLTGVVLFLFIRGGTGQSTTNIGMVYYSDNQFLNHSAVNPVFSLVSSLGKVEKFQDKFNYYTEERRAELFGQLGFNTKSNTIDTLLNTSRPNVLIILLEGMGATFVEATGGKVGVTPQMNRLSKEGILFTQCYANSYRTDRGTVCTFSGYPSFPDVSVMKIPEKSRTLPSIAHTLTNAGYRTDFVYGGDINFTNMQSYLRSTSYQHVVGETSFTEAERKTHDWGVTDRIMFDYLYKQLLTRQNKKQLWHTAFLTLASHEPWKVPYNRITDDEKANAMAYTDDCLGQFVEKLRRTPLWKNLLIICLPDHGIAYPEGVDESTTRISHIPMLWLGGAVKAPKQINSICNQSDLAATLLGQMQLPHADFRFSRDVTSSTYTYPFAMHNFREGFAFIDSTGYSIINNTTGRSINEFPQQSLRRAELGRAYLQTGYDDLGLR